MSTLPTNRAPSDDSLARMKESEFEWHNAFYAAHAPHLYPDSLEEFRRFFVRDHLTPFCDGGGSWWTDARKEMIDALGDVRGKRVLDYGCGYGMLGIYLSFCGAEVWGFDLSSAAIEVAKAAALKYALPAQFEQMDATELSYPDNFFDLVVGFGVIHHVIKYPRVGDRLFRVLKPGGTATFHETLWDNPVLNFARKFTMRDADAGDAPLRERDLRVFFRDFRTLTIAKYHLLYMAKRLAMPSSRGWSAECQPRPFWKFVKSVDQQLLRFTPLRRFCGEVVMSVQK